MSYSQQSIATPLAQLGYGHDPQSHYSQQNLHQPYSQTGYGRSPQTPQSQQVPFQQTSLSQMNSMQGPVGRFDLSAEMNCMDPETKQQFMSEYVRQMIDKRNGGPRW